MSSKRDYEDDSDGHVSEPITKRVKKQPGKSRQQQQSSGLDPTWGQKYVFSNQEAATTIPAGEESEFEDDADAMAYLMSVRYVLANSLRLVAFYMSHIAFNVSAADKLL